MMLISENKRANRIINEMINGIKLKSVFFFKGD
jgi:hypothetical protein